MATWVVDIGNSKIATVLLDNGELSDTRFIDKTSQWIDIDQFEAGDEVLISSVVPSASAALIQRLEVPQVHARLMRSAEVPMQNEYLEIENLGTDRILAAFAAFEEYAKPAGKPLIVVSLGTATTFECVSMEGVYLGGAITLGIGSIIEAVHQRTAQLPKVPLEVPGSAIGRTTIAALQSGILNTQLLGIREFTHTLAAEAFGSDKPVIIATGGLAQFTHTHLPGLFDHVDPDLVLKGLARMAKIKN